MMKIKNLSKTKKTAFIIFSTLAFLVLVFIFSNSLKSGEASSADSEWPSQLAADILNFIFGTSLTVSETSGPVRTLAHFSEFALLSFCLFGAYRNVYEKTKSVFLKTIITTFVVATVDETIQIFSEDRAFEVFDIFIDFSGGIFGALFFMLILKVFFNNKKNQERIKN